MGEVIPFKKRGQETNNDTPQQPGPPGPSLLRRCPFCEFDKPELVVHFNIETEHETIPNHCVIFCPNCGVELYRQDEYNMLSEQQLVTNVVNAWNNRPKINRTKWVCAQIFRTENGEVVEAKNALEALQDGPDAWIPVYLAEDVDR